jgi:rhamnogalacturonan endolyase
VKGSIVYATFCKHLSGLIYPGALLLFASQQSLSASSAPGQLLSKPIEWFRSSEGRTAADNILSWQSDEGSWPKNFNTAAIRNNDLLSKVKGTFDNGASTDELRYLARAFLATDEPRYRAAFLKGLDTILRAQYSSGGWPQSFPPPEHGYARYITFNDDTMVRLMVFLREVSRSTDYVFVPADQKETCLKAFNRGVDCILKCQMRVSGKLTVWCAQHDERDFSPRPARTFELVSLSGAESARILQLLMSLNDPKEEVIRAVEAGVAWFETAKLTGIRQAQVNGDKLIVQDPNARPLWARFYEIGTNRPIFSGRDSVKKYNIAEIEPERRNGYAWYGEWGRTVQEQFVKWKSELSRNARQMEQLGRGLIAINQGSGNVFLSWRLLASDPPDVTFNVYRQIADHPEEKLHTVPLANSTCFTDTNSPLRERTTYSVRPVSQSPAKPPATAFTFPPNAPVRSYLSIPLQLPTGYTANDASTGDLDGDGELELILKSEQRPRDPAANGLSGQTILQGYKTNGTLLWTIDLGKNIREGAHYTPFIVYDLDGNGIAEIACKTADGTIDGKGKTIGDPDADWRDTSTQSRTFGRVLKGPEYLTLFNGQTGAALATTNYIPSRGDLGGWGGIGGNGGNDTVGNRADRFLACVAYLDGVRPSLVMCRGYYGRSVLAAWDWHDGNLTSRWVFDSRDKDDPYSGQGGHQLSVADVDADGRDEIIYHSMVVDDDGRGLFTTGLRHGDALHVGDLDPMRPGLEVFGIHENEQATVKLGTPGTALFDARTGAILWSHGPGTDVGRGLSADIDPRHPGEEMWSGPAGLRTCKGESIGAAPTTANFAVWWDGDLLRELLDRNRIYKWDWNKSELATLFTAEGCSSNNGSKATPALVADLFGDWREEVVWRTSDNTELRIYTTTVPTDHRLPTLMQDPQYRLSIAWQNVGYNQPPHPGFYLGAGMTNPPLPRLKTAGTDHSN